MKALKLKKSIIDTQLEASRMLAIGVINSTTDKMLKRAARQLITDIDFCMNEKATATLGDFKRITRMTYRLVACVNGGLS